MNEDDRIRLQHMLDAARKTQIFVNNATRQTLDSNDMLVFALVHAIAIIGEAAARVSEQGRAACPQIPWAAVIGMRNRLIHAYFDVNLNILWDTVIKSIPELITELEKLLPAEE